MPSKYTDKNIEMDTLLKAKLDDMIANMVNGSIAPIVLITGTGKTRIGKTTLGSQIGYYVAWTLNIPFSVNNVAFEPEEYQKLVTTTERNVIIYDESAKIASSGAANTHLQRETFNLIRATGAKYHFTIIVMTDFFSISTQLIRMSHALINTYALQNEYRTLTDEECKRIGTNFKPRDNKYIPRELGYYNYLGESATEELANQKNKNKLPMKQLINHYSNFIGQFGEGFAFDDIEYSKRKTAFMNKLSEKEQKVTRMYDRNLLIYALYMDGILNQKQIAALFSKYKYPMTQQAINTVISDLNKQTKETKEDNYTTKGFGGFSMPSSRNKGVSSGE